MDATAQLVNGVSSQSKHLTYPNLSPNGQDWYDFARVVSYNRMSTMRSLMPNAYAVDQGSAIILMKQNISNIFNAVYDEDFVVDVVCAW